MTTLADLVTPSTQLQIFNKLLAVFKAYGFPTESWQDFGTDKVRLLAFTSALLDISENYIPAIAKGGFVGDGTNYATGDWLTLLSEEIYNVPRNDAGFTIGNITLTAAATAGPYTIVAGQLTAIFASSGNRYRNTSGGTLSSGGTLVVTFKAESAGAAYNDPSNSGTLSLVSPLPGVTLTNPAGTYTLPGHVGAGTGTLTLAGTPALPHSVTLRIDATSASNPAAVSYSLDGAPYVSAGTISSITNLAGTGINITFVNGVSGTSWVLADTYTFNTPGSWITTQGSDEESDPNLAARDNARWSSLSSIPVSNFYYLLATSTPSVGSQVTTVIVQPDSVVSAQINMVVAGPAGVLPPATVAAIQAYVTPLVPGTERCIVLSPSTLAVTLAGLITCKASALLTVQAAVQTAMTNLNNAVGINGVWRLASIVDEVMDIADTVDITGVTINGVAANLTLGSPTTFVLPSLQALAFTYATVA